MALLPVRQILDRGWNLAIGISVSQAVLLRSPQRAPQQSPAEPRLARKGGPPRVASEAPELDDQPTIHCDLEWAASELNARTFPAST